MSVDNQAGMDLFDLFGSICLDEDWHQDIDGHSEVRSQTVAWVALMRSVGAILSCRPRRPALT